MNTVVGFTVVFTEILPSHNPYHMHAQDFTVEAMNTVVGDTVVFTEILPFHNPHHLPRISRSRR